MRTRLCFWLHICRKLHVVADLLSIEILASKQSLPRPEDLAGAVAMAEHEGAVYEDSMVRAAIWFSLPCLLAGPCHGLGLCSSASSQMLHSRPTRWLVPRTPPPCSPVAQIRAATRRSTHDATPAPLVLNELGINESN